MSWTDTSEQVSSSDNELRTKRSTQRMTTMTSVFRFRAKQTHFLRIQYEQWGWAQFSSSIFTYRYTIHRYAGLKNTSLWDESSSDVLTQESLFRGGKLKEEEEKKKLHPLHVVFQNFNISRKRCQICKRSENSVNMMKSLSVSDAHSKQSHDSIPFGFLTQPEPLLSSAADVQQLTTWFLQRADMELCPLRRNVSWLFGSLAARLTTALTFVCFTLASQQSSNQSFHNKCGSNPAFTSADGKFQLHAQRRFLLLSISRKPLYYLYLRLTLMTNPPMTVIVTVIWVGRSLLWYVSTRLATALTQQHRLRKKK